MVRAAARRHEMSVRLALGSTRWQLARQLLAESLLLAGLGAAAGLVFAAWASRVVVASLSTPDTKVALDLSLDWRVLAATAFMAVLTAVLFGTGPAFRASRAVPIDALRDRGQGAASGARSGGLVVLQVALSLVLLVAAGSFVATFRRLAALPLGFDAHRILVFDVDTARAHTDPSSRLAYYQQLVDTVRAVPGVASAAASTMTPFNAATKSPLFADPARVHEQVISPEFFATYGQVIRAGRDFDRRDSAQAPRVAIVSESYVRRFLAGRDPLAATVESGPCDQRRGACAIVGVVTDAALGALRVGLRPSIYFPLAQSAGLGPPGRTTIAISLRSTSGSPALLASGVADALTRPRSPAVVFKPADRAGCRSGTDTGTAAGDPVVVLWRAGAAVVGPRSLRHDRACRRAAAQRDRHPARPRGDTDARASPGAPAHADGDRARHARRHGRERLGVAVHRQPSFRCAAWQSRHHRRGRPDPDGGCRHCERGSRTSGSPNGSGGRLEGSVAAA